ncbi:AMP deaminase [Sarracenia purpurea var. burkii]
MDTYVVHLTMTALVGASFVAISTYYMHRKTLNQLLEFAKAMEREREREREDGDDEVGHGESPQHSKKYGDKWRGHGRRKGIGNNRRSSASLLDVMAIFGDVEGDERPNGPVPIGPCKFSKKSWASD